MPDLRLGLIYMTCIVHGLRVSQGMGSYEGRATKQILPKLQAMIVEPHKLKPLGKLLLALTPANRILNFHTRDHRSNDPKYRQQRYHAPVGQAVASQQSISMPEFAPEGLRNRLWKWRGQQIRYVCAGEELGKDAPAVLMVHGLFVNADHWRNNIAALSKNGFRVFAVDLLGSGYSSKPFPTSEEVGALNGEDGRNLSSPNVQLGDASGSLRNPVPVDLRHPLGSVYNFYTWAEQLADFAVEVIDAGDGQPVTLVCNSIGTISGLQAAIDRSEIFDSVFIVNPNFRELHTAESPAIIQPVVRFIQRVLREKGRPLFDSLAKPNIVKNILKEPYYDADTVTDDLVDVLLSPLLIEGSADVVFDTLSYSGGPLPEQQLGDPALKARVAICLGEEDPWTPVPRVQALDRFDKVECITLLPGTGHCPHDEAPHLVNPLIVDFVRDCRKAKA